MEVTFANPQFLLFMLSIPLLVISHFFTMVYLKRRAFKFANMEAIKRVTGGDKASFRNTIFLSRNLGLLLLRVFVLLFLIFSAAGTTIWVDRLTSEFDVVIAIDASSSMLADDFQPSRLGAAKNAAIDFISKLGAQTSVGVVSFSGASFIEQPLTNDLGAVQDAIGAIEVRRVGGTDVGGAMTTATNVLLGSTGTPKSRVIILLTDGQSNVGSPIEDGIAYANENQVRVYTIGVATEEGGRFLRVEGVSTIDEASLTKIATETGGNYYRAQSVEGLTAHFNDILASSRQRSPTSVSQILLLLALVLLFIEWGLISTKYRSVP